MHHYFYCIYIIAVQEIVCFSKIQLHLQRIIGIYLSILVLLCFRDEGHPAQHIKLMEWMKCKLNFSDCLNYISAFFKKNLVICLILASGLCARFLFYLSIDGAIYTSDSPTYIDGAFSLYYHLWLNEYRPPVYPLGLMAVGILFYWDNMDKGIVILQVFLSLTTILFLYKLLIEAFNSKAIAYVSSFLTAVSFRVFSWDFVVLSENFAIFIVTLVSYYTVRYMKYEKQRDFKRLAALLITAIFTKPFFLLLPLAIFLLLLLRRLFIRDFNFRSFIQKVSLGLSIIYFSVFAYSLVNYAQNVYFGITTVGNVNYLGKVLQYNMEGYGDNEALKEDIKYAFKTEKPEFKVNGKYLEPWHFVGTYGWASGHYMEVGKFAKEIIMRHPVKYIIESTKLTYQLLVLNSPFKDYIAEGALEKAGHTNPVFNSLRSVTENVNLLYILLAVCLLEIIFLPVRFKQGAFSERNFFTFFLMAIVMYHYVISAFFSYGDYCRLLAPCYPVIYSIIGIYLCRFFSFIRINAKALSKAKVR